MVRVVGNALDLADEIRVPHRGIAVVDGLCGCAFGETAESVACLEREKRCELLRFQTFVSGDGNFADFVRFPFIQDEFDRNMFRVGFVFMNANLLDDEIEVALGPVEVAEAHNIVVEFTPVEESEVEERNPVEPGVLVHDRIFQFAFGKRRGIRENHLIDFLLEIFLDAEFDGDGTVLFGDETRINLRVVVSGVRVELAQGVGGIDETFVIEETAGGEGDFFAQFLFAEFFVSGDDDFIDDRFRGNPEDKVDFAVRSLFRFGGDIGEEASGVQALDVVVDGALIVACAFAALDVHAEDVIGEAPAVRLFKRDGIQLLGECGGAEEKADAESGDTVFFHGAGGFLLVNLS